MSAASDLRAAERDVVHFVRAFAELHESLPTRSNEERARWRYKSIEGLLMGVGRFWTPQAFPPLATTWREPKQCFRNALHLAIEHGLAYCEGYGHSGLIVTPHAWCLDRKGRVVDPTWSERGVAYLGIAFESRWAVGVVAKQETYGLLWESDAGFGMVTHGVPAERLADIHRTGRVPKWATD